MRLRRHLRPGAIAAVLTLATATAGLVFVLAPDLAPDPRDEVSATLDVQAVEPGVSVGRWARRSFGEAADDALREIYGGAGPTADDLAFAGHMVHVRLEASGFEGRSVRLRATIYDDRTQRPANVPALPLRESIELDAPSRSSVQYLLVPDLRVIGPDRAFVRVEVFDDVGTIAMDDSSTLVRGLVARR